MTMVLLWEKADISPGVARTSAARHIQKNTSAGAAMADSDTPTQPIQVFTSDQSMHDVMRQQVAEMLANSDLTEEQKQQILVSMSCPCCGGGGVSLSIRLKD
jgi:hypothetical protein